MNIPSGLKRFLKKVLIRRKELETFNLYGDSFTVVDISYRLGVRPTIRAIEHHGGKVFSSLIYLDDKYGHPYLRPVQAMIKAWGGEHEYRNALVLGCAGCSLPRFIDEEYPSCAITGVEYAEKMIEIAKKYFLDGIDERFHLIHADAFEYVPTYQADPFDLIIVDLFQGKGLVKSIFTDDFLSHLKGICSEKALVVFNLSTSVTQEEVSQYKTPLKKNFSSAALMQMWNSRFLALFPGKNSDDEVAAFKQKTAQILRL